MVHTTFPNLLLGFYYRFRESRLNHNQSIIEFDLKNRYVYVKLISEQDDSSDPMRRGKRLDDFLGCNRKYDNHSQVKGIYYNEELNTFFIFIDRFYLQIGEDLVKKNFRNVFVGDYMSQARSLEFESYKVSRQVLFEDAATKWVRIADKNETQLFLFDQWFRITASSSGLTFKKQPRDSENVVSA